MSERRVQVYEDDPEYDSIAYVRAVGEIEGEKAERNQTERFFWGLLVCGCIFLVIAAFNDSKSRNTQQLWGIGGGLIGALSSTLVNKMKGK